MINLKKYVCLVLYKTKLKDFSNIDFTFWGDLKGRDINV